MPVAQQGRGFGMPMRVKSIRMNRAAREDLPERETSEQGPKERRAGQLGGGAVRGLSGAVWPAEGAAGAKFLGGGPLGVQRTAKRSVGLEQWVMPGFSFNGSRVDLQHWAPFRAHYSKAIQLHICMHIYGSFPGLKW